MFYSVFAKRLFNRNDRKYVKKIKAQRPIIALTKSDECNLSSMAMSKIAELKVKLA